MGLLKNLLWLKTESDLEVEKESMTIGLSYDSQKLDLTEGATIPHSSIIKSITNYC